jgi:hypothetical protein
MGKYGSLFSTKFPSLSTHFFHLCERHSMLVALTLFAEASKLFTHSVFQLVIAHKNGVLGVNLQGAKDGS